MGQDGRRGSGAKGGGGEEGLGCKDWDAGARGGMGETGERSMRETKLPTNYY
jgi:hypothetical protein